MSVDQTPERAELREQLTQAVLGYNSEYGRPEKTIDAILQLVTQYAAAQAQAARIDELERIDPVQTLAVLTKDDKGKPEWVNRRLAELHQTGQGGGDTDQCICNFWPCRHKPADTKGGA